MESMDLNKYSEVIWDWNGTLFDDVNLCNNIMNHLLVSRSLPTLTLNRYKDIFTFPVREYYLKAGYDFSREPFEKIGAEFMVEYEEKKMNCKLFPYSAKVLNNFQSLNIRQHLLSAYEQESLTTIIKYHGISEYFTFIKGLDHIYADDKVNIGKQLMKEISVDGTSSEVILIGDTIHDFEVANELGIDCLLVGNGHQNIDRLKELQVKVINNIKELYSHLNKKGISD